MRRNKIVLGILLLSGIMMFAASCNNGVVHRKGCGCGADLNRNYRSSRR
ncbi:MAG: hypothetical protein WCG87_03485 [Bacteroidota bacterium]